MDKIRKRTVAALCLIALMLALDMGFVVKSVFFYDQSELTSLATQYRRTVLRYWPRGQITDRSGIPFTNRRDPAVQGVFAPTKLSPVAYYVIGAVRTDPEDTTSSGARGVNGLQAAYDSLLSGGAAISVSAPVDAQGKVIGEGGYLVSGDHINEGCTLTLTLDYHLQKAVEELIAEACESKGYAGVAVIVSDVRTGEMLVMASHGDSMNKSVLSYQPGSLMKIITAAAALEEGVIDPDEKFVCTGSVVINGTSHYCASRVAHGELTFEEAFSKSCNTTFYTVAKRLEYRNENGQLRNKLVDKALEWGFCEYGNPSPEFELDYEGYYSFVSSEIYNDEGVFNAALGQGKTQASAYLINKIVAAVAMDGLSTKPYIVSSITDPAGGSVRVDSRAFFDLNLTEETLNALRTMMRRVCVDGSGSANTLEKYGGMSGKTGTSENSSGKAHAWFAGYFPYESPRYSVTVFIEQGESSREAVSLMGGVADVMHGLGFLPYAGQVDMF